MVSIIGLWFVTFSWPRVEDVSVREAFGDAISDVSLRLSRAMAASGFDLRLALNERRNWTSYLGCSPLNALFLGCGAFAILQ
jgi:hypothetical protein